jgi:chromosome segregation ATPase
LSDDSSFSYNRGYLMGQVHAEGRRQHQEFVEWMRNRLCPQPDPVRETIDAWAQHSAELEAQGEALAAENARLEQGWREALNSANGLKEDLVRLDAEAIRLREQVAQLQAEKVLLQDKLAARERWLEYTEGQLKKAHEILYPI